MTRKYTFDQKRIALVGAISLLDNKLITERHAGNRKAIALQLDMLREILRELEKASEYDPRN